MTACHDCGSRPQETRFPNLPRARPRLCCDCIAERARATARGLLPAQPARHTRASYRAALRHRAKLPQPDLIDPIMPRP